MTGSSAARSPPKMNTSATSRTGNDIRAPQITSWLRAVVISADTAASPDTDVIVVRARVAALDQLVARIVRADTAVRELAPVVSPLEAAFLALTEQPTLTEQEAGR